MFRIETPKSERGRQGILLHRQEKNRLEQESKQAAFQEEMSQNLSESFISLQAYLMDSFAEQHSLLQKTNSIAQQKKTAQAEQTAVISKDMSEGLSPLTKSAKLEIRANILAIFFIYFR